MFRLSKSKLMSALQCPKRLFLEIHQPELRERSESSERAFAIGNEVGEAARRAYKDGELIATKDPDQSVVETMVALAKRQNMTVFEAGFFYGAVLVRADIVTKRKGGFHLAEVKSSTDLKPHYVYDVAIQNWVIEGSDVPLKSSHLWHIDNTFTYEGNGDYRGLFKKENVTDEANSLVESIPRFVAESQKILAGGLPAQEIGPHCHTPYDCPFLSHCSPPEAEYPVDILPYGGSLLKKLISDGYEDLRDVPKALLTKERHLRVWRSSKSGKAEIDPAAKKELRALPFPRYYLDFETVQFAVPIWAGTRPYQQLPFQWSCHVESEGGRLTHLEFLDSSGQPPMRDFAESLINALGGAGPILVYTHFERTILRGLIERFPDLDLPLNRIIKRIFDLYPFTQANYYHPAMKGSWSIKSVLPTIAPDMDYQQLEHVQDGGGAQDAYREILREQTDPERREVLVNALKTYCGHDTLALVALARFFEGRSRS